MLPFSRVLKKCVSKKKELRRDTPSPNCAQKWSISCKNWMSLIEWDFRPWALGYAEFFFPLNRSHRAGFFRFCKGRFQNSLSNRNLFLAHLVHQELVIQHKFHNLMYVFIWSVGPPMDGGRKAGCEADAICPTGSRSDKRGGDTSTSRLDCSGVRLEGQQRHKMKNACNLRGAGGWDTWPCWLPSTSTFGGLITRSPESLRLGARRKAVFTSMIVPLHPALPATRPQQRTPKIQGSGNPRFFTLFLLFPFLRFSYSLPC